MSNYRPYNPNTKYGRRKAREQAARNYQNGSQEYRDEMDSLMGCFWVCAIIATVIIFIVVALTSGTDKAIDVIK